MFADLLVKAEQKRQAGKQKEIRKKEVLNLFKSLAEKAEPELSAIFKTIKIRDDVMAGNIMASHKQKEWLSDREMDVYVIDICSYLKDDPYIYVGNGYNRHYPLNIPFKWDMTNAQLTIIYQNALRAMVSKALRLS